MVAALERHAGEVVYLGPDTGLLSNAIEKAGLAASRCSYALFKKRLSPDHNRVLSRRLARYFKKRIIESGCDVLFAPLASAELAYLETEIPIVYVSDLNWADIVDYYPGCSSLFAFAQAEGERIERLALARAGALIYPSKWAATTARVHYGMPGRKVHVVPYGANLLQVPSREAALNHRIGDTIELLWVGVNWERKGGGVAFDCLQALSASGIQARLTVCGCVPPKRYDDPRMRVIPFLRKSDPGDLKRLSQLYLDAHVFLFPTRAEALGVVLCEASAHGLPSLARNTGGVGGAVTDGENGFLMPPDASGREYAERVTWLLQNPLEYERMVRASRDAYERRLNWDAWSQTVKTIFQQVLSPGSRAPGH
jgi:glycosyltransferase involved in cell wall biosynthesis